MPIGVVGYTVRFHTYTAKQVEDTYAKIAALGYDGVESGLGRRLGIDKDVELLKKYNLKVCDAYGDLSKPDEAMESASRYGVKILGIPSIPGDMLHSVDGFKAYAEQINELSRPFKAAGFRLQYHNHSQEFRNFPELDGKAGMAILIEETDPEAVLFEIDTHWVSAAGGDPAQWILKVKNRIPIVHFKDYAIDWKAEDGGMGFVPKRYAEVGQGNINWPPVIDACREAGVEWYLIEQDRTPGSEFDSLKISIDAMLSLGVR